MEKYSTVVRTMPVKYGRGAFHIDTTHAVHKTGSHLTKQHTTKASWHRAIAGFSFFLAMAGTAQAAHPIAAVGTEGLSVIATGGEVFATYQGSTAAYTDLLHLNGGSTDIFKTVTNPTSVGTQVSLGSFAAGTELVFNIRVTDQNQTFYSGSKSRNADAKEHARVQANWQANTTLVSFEDGWKVNEGAGGFNDMSFSLTGVSVSAVPEPASMALALVGVIAIASLKRKHK